MDPSVWHENEAFWDAFEDYVFSPAVIEKAPAQIEQVLSLLDLPDDWSWMENRWILVSDEEEREFTVSHRLYSAYELTTLSERVGFANVSVYGNLNGDPYDEDATRLVVVATA
ncbi:hypothetical protein [Halocatena pleomorpha]|uniref:Uncharacterized protein n=1 Tax=Halocatena pleomorpha TaxID=1785090 RepID=A0A3P3RDK8_9EURY|nr:hypothetical protein [Halocatena pleomorpha]RRJ31048.1 hypothetical protein EIK79_08555 [Halocatena pleomorpha]